MRRLFLSVFVISALLVSGMAFEAKAANEPQTSTVVKKKKKVFKKKKKAVAGAATAGTPAPQQ